MARTAAASGLRIEYGLIAAGIAVAIIAAVNGLGSQVTALVIIALGGFIQLGAITDAPCPAIPAALRDIRRDPPRLIALRTVARPDLRPGAASFAAAIIPHLGDIRSR